MGLEFYDILRDEEPDDFEVASLSAEGQQAAEYIDYIRGDRDVNDEVAGNVELLWREPAIQHIWKNRAELKIDFADSTAYFFDEVRRIADPQFLPNDKDILLVRHRTTGVIDQSFSIQNTTFHIFDVGGQKSERKKWIHCFEHVTAVIFVASLSCYDEVMFEDDRRNAMEDSLSLFENICNQRWFELTAMILFLNKRDLFAEKIESVPITKCFADYNGPQTYDSCVSFIRDEFEGRNRNPQGKQIYSHVTCATERTNVEKVFGDVQHIVINTSLAKGGLI